MNKKLLVALAYIPLIITACNKSGGSKPSQVTLSSISLSGSYQTTFVVDSTFNYDGLVVTAYYSNNTSKEVSNYTVSNPNMSIVGTQEVTVSYTEKSVTKDAKYNITINNSVQEKYLTGITLSGVYQTEFNLNETFNYTGLIVNASYSDGSSAVVSGFTVSSPDMTTEGNKTVTVTYTEKNYTESASYTINVTDPGEETPITEEQREAMLQELRNCYNNLDSADYTTKSWNRIVDLFTKAVYDLKKATTVERATRIKDTAIEAMNAVVKQSEVTKGTLFDHHSSNSNYEFDRDEDNNIVISYNGYPGRWVHCGTTTNLKEPATDNNVFELTFRNDIAEGIEVCLQMTEGDYKVDSRIVNVNGNETKTIRLEYDIVCSNLYFFVDSCSEHNRVGQITILSTEFSYEKREEDSRLYEPKDVMINQAISKTDDGTASSYTLLEADHPLNIERISVRIEVDYNGNEDDSHWFGLVIHAGNQKSEQLKQSMGNEQSTDVGANFIFNYELPAHVVAGNKIYVRIEYAADNLEFNVASYRLHYCVNSKVQSETVEVNQPIFENGSGYIGGVKENGYLTATINYSSFLNHSRVKKMDIQFTTINNKTWGGCGIYITGFEFTNFETGNNNVLNIGSIMDVEKSGKETTGTITIYPIGNFSLKSEGTIEMICWWASATYIRVDSVTMYTDVSLPPESVTSLEAHPIDSGMVLTWGASELASVYEVYMNDELKDTVSTTYATIEHLTNGTTYSFSVVAKNASGESDPVSVNAAPVEGGTYDNFIEGLNTTLEELIGKTGIAKMFGAGEEYANIANNYRLKRVIDKMKNGEETTIAYMGGSITVGENASLKDEDSHQKGYAYYSYEWLRRTYDKENKSEFINASISGTGSEIGIVRAQEDVLDHSPDLIFIEFAANNGSTDLYKQTYESLIRKCLTLENNPAVILLFSCTYYSLNGAETYMSQIGNHYALPMYTFNKALRSICTPYNNKQDKTGDEIWNAFSDDGTHPNDNGHQLYAKGLCYFLRNLITRDSDEEPTLPDDPSKPGYDKYQSLEYYNNKNSSAVVKSLGSFVAADTATPSTSLQSDVTAFQNGWKKTDTTSNEAMSIEVSAKNFILIYEAGNSSVSGDPKGNIIVSYVNKNDASDAGELTWDVSKTAKQEKSGSTEITDQSSNGWENPVGILIFDKDVVDTYVITIKMENNAGICTIMAFGYSK